MGLLDRLDNSGTGYNGGANSSTLSPTFGNALSKPLSIRHKTFSINNNPQINGSLVADYFPFVTKGFGIKPTPSLLDIGGVNPWYALKDNNFPSWNNSFSCGEYFNCAPAGSHI